jgi:hypothetical protein
MQCHQSNFNWAMEIFKTSWLRKGQLLICMTQYRAVLKIPWVSSFFTLAKDLFQGFGVWTIPVSFGTGFHLMVYLSISKHNSSRIMMGYNRDSYWRIQHCMNEYSIILRLQGLWEQYVQQLNSEGSRGSAENGKHVWPHMDQYWRIFENTNRTRA